MPPLDRDSNEDFLPPRLLVHSGPIETSLECVRPLDAYIHGSIMGWDLGVQLVQDSCERVVCPACFFVGVGICAVALKLSTTIFASLPAYIESTLCGFLGQCPFHTSFLCYSP